MWRNGLGERRGTGERRGGVLQQFGPVAAVAGGARPARRLICVPVCRASLPPRICRQILFARPNLADNICLSG